MYDPQTAVALFLTWYTLPCNIKVVLKVIVKFQGHLRICDLGAAIQVQHFNISAVLCKRPLEQREKTVFFTLIKTICIFYQQHLLFKTLPLTGGNAGKEFLWLRPVADQQCGSVSALRPITITQPNTPHQAIVRIKLGWGWEYPTYAVLTSVGKEQDKNRTETFKAVLFYHYATEVQLHLKD